MAEVGRLSLGSQGLEVSAQGLGCMGMSYFYGPPKPEAEMIDLIRYAVSRGITFLDTSDVYGPYTNEILLGKAIKGIRDKVQIATKFGMILKEGGSEFRGDAAYVRASCEGSLKRLDVDYIDLYYQHRVDTRVPIEETVGELKKLVEEGKIKYIGLSEASASTIRRAHAVHPITAVQLEWSLWSRDVEEEIIPTCRELGIGIVPYSPLGRGFLSYGAKLVENLTDDDYRKVGGKMTSLKKHIAAVDSDTLFQCCDFKLASCQRPSDQRIAKECGFTSLSVRAVKEVVTLGFYPLVKSPPISNAGKHLSAIEFHSVLQMAGKSHLDMSLESLTLQLDSKPGDFQQHRGLVLLDARNAYETRIGKFLPPKGVEILEPKIRQYSDLPSWIDGHLDQLHGNHILMYCTGGVRCEMASAYIRMKGSGYENVYQLSGGIQRYLEAYPDGGYFKGKNFVFDHRISVGSSDTEVIGSCLLCANPFDDYSLRCRCSYCRMLVLVCNTCQDCHITKEPSTKKLKILCLHGFRQNASNLKGRLASLTRKLKLLADFVFVDAPHEVPFLYQPVNNQVQYSKGNDHTAKGCTDSVNHSQLNFMLPQNCKKKRAWLVTPNCYHSDFAGFSTDMAMSSGASSSQDATLQLPFQRGNTGEQTNWIQATAPFDRLQYQQQTAGWPETLTHLQGVFSDMGPFDGVLGFSQGAAVAATLCTQRQRNQGHKGYIDFDFVILCSGFPSPAEEFQQLASHLSISPIDCPSLHLFGDSAGLDRQIMFDASMKLVSFFRSDCCVVLRHNSGHIVPAQSPYIDTIKDFLRMFL